MRHIIIASHYGLAAGLGDTLKAIIGPGHDIRGNVLYNGPPDYLRRL